MRITNTSLLSLLNTIDQAASTDHPLSELYRTLIKDALLDLRDARGTINVLETVNNYQSNTLDAIKQSIFTVKNATSGNVPVRDLAWQLDNCGVNHMDYTKRRLEGMLPLTGKEK